MLAVILFALLYVLLTLGFVCLFIKYDRKQTVTKSKLAHMGLIGGVSFGLSFLPLPLLPMMAVVLAAQSAWYYKAAKDLSYWQSLKIWLLSNIAAILLGAVILKVLFKAV